MGDTTYEYQPLEGESWIRVLQSLPSSSHDDELICQIFHIDREVHKLSLNPERNHYSAVSYAWGKAEFSACLAVLGTEDAARSVIKITPNVDVMLRWFRKTYKSVNLWIDAICLNQRDREEIQQQLPLMGGIYAQAQKTRIWLGDDNNGLAAAFALCRYILDGRTGRDLDESFYQGVRKQIDLSQALNYLQALKTRPWFSRRWVLQETHLSRNPIIFCRDQRLPWKDLVHVNSRLFDRNDRRSPLLQSVNERFWDDDRYSYKKPDENQQIHPLLCALWTFHEAECSEPRDKIFSLLGFITSGLGSLKYDQPWELVFRDIAFHLITSGVLEEVLNHVQAFGSLHDTKQNIPSWVPNWNTTRSEGVKCLPSVRKRASYSTLHNLEFPLRFDATGRMLDLSFFRNWTSAKDDDLSSRVPKFAFFDEQINGIQTVQHALVVRACLHGFSRPRSLKDVAETFKQLIEPSEYDYAFDESSYSESYAPSIYCQFSIRQLFDKTWGIYEQWLFLLLMLLLPADATEAQILELCDNKLQQGTIFITEKLLVNDTNHQTLKWMVGYSSCKVLPGDFMTIPTPPPGSSLRPGTKLHSYLFRQAGDPMSQSFQDAVSSLDSFKLIGGTLVGTFNGTAEVGLCEIPLAQLEDSDPEARRYKASESRGRLRRELFFLDRDLEHIRYSTLRHVMII